MSDFSDKTVLIYDHGLYPHVASKLAESFGKVLYFVNWVSDGFPSSRRRHIGKGIPNVERVYTFWNYVDDTDLVVFPDVYNWDEAERCRELGKPVWAAGKAEALELERWETRELMAELGMPVIPAELIKGVDALADYLEEHADEKLHIKSSSAIRGGGRGDFETFHHDDLQISLDWLRKLSSKLGPWRNDIEFVVEEHVPGKEWGYDGYFAGGFGRVALYGPEEKDAGYLGQVVPFSELPAPIRIPTERLGVAMEQLGCRGFYSNEIRISDDGTPYLIDPAMRCGSPPSESYIELFSNWDEVIWAGAHNEIVDLEPEAMFVAQIVLKSQEVKDGPLPVYYPEEIARWVKLHNYCVIDDQVTVIQQDFPEFGSVIGLGNSKKAAQDAALEHAEQIKALDLEWKTDVFDAIDKTIKESKVLGVNF